MVVTHCTVSHRTLQCVLRAEVFNQFIHFNPNEVSDVLEIRGVLWPSIAFRFRFRPPCCMFRVKLVVAQNTVDERTTVQCEPIDGVFPVFIIGDHQQFSFLCVNPCRITQNPIATVVNRILVTQLCDAFPYWLTHSCSPEKLCCCSHTFQAGVVIKKKGLPQQLLRQSQPTTSDQCGSNE